MNVSRGQFLYFVGLVITSIATSMANGNISSGLLVLGIGIGVVGFCMWCNERN